MTENKFITIEGCIGAGKTTLCKLLANEFNIPPVLENFEDNPYLDNFYKNPDKHAFPLELYFMAERYQQQKTLLSKVNLFENIVFSDYAFFKSYVFAGITLKKEDEMQLFKMLYNIIHPNIKQPDLIIYLHKSIPRLLENIKQRGRPYETEISEKYLFNLNKAYIDYFKTNNTSKIVLVDSEHLDFVENQADYKFFKELITRPFKVGLNYL